MFFLFVLDMGGKEISLDVCILALVMLVSLRAYHPLRSRYVVWTILVAAALVSISLIMPWTDTNTHEIANVLKLLSIVLSIHCLFIMRDTARTKIYLKAALMALLLVTIAWQFVSIAVFHLPFGMFTNPHYLGSLSVLTLPMVFYFYYTSQGLRRTIFSVAAVLNVGILILSDSRPAWISITLGSLFGITVFFRGKKKWMGLLLLVGMVVFMLSVDGMVKGRLGDLLENIPQEERVFLWKEAMEVLKDNTLPEWTLGHGIGSDRAIRYSSYPNLHFPHNFLIETLYNNGIVGIFLIVIPLTLLFVKLRKGIDALTDRGDKVFLGCLMVVFIAWLLHASVVFPVYSKSTLYPFSLILGAMVSWGERLRGLVPETRPKSHCRSSEGV